MDRTALRWSIENAERDLTLPCKQGWLAEVEATAVVATVFIH